MLDMMEEMSGQTDRHKQTRTNKQSLHNLFHEALLEFFCHYTDTDRHVNTDTDRHRQTQTPVISMASTLQRDRQREARTEVNGDLVELLVVHLTWQLLDDNLKPLLRCSHTCFVR
jgi:hypothetical protein